MADGGERDKLRPDALLLQLDSFFRYVLGNPIEV